MPKSELPTRDYSLAELPLGVSARIVAIDAVRSPQLAAHGIRRGVVVSVEDDAPFGGPRIIRLGAARIAVARAIARTIRVRPETRSESAAR